MYTIGVERKVLSMRNDYEVRAERFIHQIYDYIRDCKTLRQFESAVYRFNDDYNRKVMFSHGLTRVCFITSDYVVKYNFGTEHHIRDFGGCDDEVRMYAIAERDGFAYLLAKPTMVEYMGHSFCIMPRIYGIERYEKDVECYLKGAEYNWVSAHIYDCHNQNYGWKHGHPVIFDYACCS